MPVFNNILAGAAGQSGGAAAGDYTIQRSLRFDSGAQSNLSRSFSQGNQKKWTWSAWVKRSKLASNDYLALFTAPAGPGNDGIFFRNNGISLSFGYSGSGVECYTSSVFIDTFAWYNICVSVNTEEATPANRIKVWVNNQLHTLNQYPQQNGTASIGSASLHHIGLWKSGSSANYPFGGYMCDVHYLDGIAITSPEGVFGAYSSDTGAWNPIGYTGSYNSAGVGQMYSGMLTSSSGYYSSSHTAEKAFDGDLSTNAWNANNYDNYMEFTPTTPISFTNGVQVYCYAANGYSITNYYSVDLDGNGLGSETTFVGGGANFNGMAWISVATGSGTLHKLRIRLTRSGSGSGVQIGAIAINGSGSSSNYLVDGTPAGVNGFKLDFSDSSSNASLGNDAAGSNNWTVNNLIAGQFSPTITTGGDPTTSTNSPFSSGDRHSVDFDGNDKLTMPGPGVVSGDYTMECFVKASSYSGIQRFFSANEGVNSGQSTMLRCWQGSHEFYHKGGVSDNGTTIPTNQWNHLAMTRSGSTVSYYMNGTRLGTDTNSDAITITTLVVAHGFGSEYFTGAVSNARFVDGQALYTGSSYTVPTLTLTTTSQGASAGNVRALCCHQNTVTGSEGVITAASETDSLFDSPTNYDDGTNIGGNYCTLNPLDNQQGNGTLSNGNLDITQNTTQWAFYRSTMFVSSGKWYWECTLGNNQYSTIGICTDAWSMGSATNAWANEDTSMYGYYPYNGEKYNGNSGASYATADTSAAGSVIGVALDMDNGTLTFYKDGTSLGTAYTGLAGKNVSPTHWLYNQNNADSYNFGQRPFKYAPGTAGGPAATFKALCTQNLGNPAITDSSTAFIAKTFTANASNQTIATNFSPDLVWVKSRANAYGNELYDIVRGTNLRLTANTTAAEQNQAGQLTAFNSDGFTLGSSSSSNYTNNTTSIAWAWDAGSSTVSNTDGSIATNVRASQTNGFSISTYQGNGSANQTLGHGLGKAPAFVIIKDRSSSQNWAVMHTSSDVVGTLDGGTEYEMLELSSTAASSNYSYDTIWHPTSTTVKIAEGSSSAHWVNKSGDNYVMYAWTPVEGFSAFGSYISTNTGDGPCCVLGFKPRWIMFKNASSAWGWYIHDTARSVDNPAAEHLIANSSNAESTYSIVNILSNGFKLTAVSEQWNKNSDKIVYAAFAENPFKYARAS